MCVIIIPRENRGIKNQENCINYGREVEEKGLTYLETYVCLCRDFDMLLAIFSFLWSPWLFFMDKPSPDYFVFQKIFPPTVHLPQKLKWPLP